MYKTLIASVFMVFHIHVFVWIQNAFQSKKEKKVIKENNATCAKCYVGCCAGATKQPFVGHSRDAC